MPTASLLTSPRPSAVATAPDSDALATHADQLLRSIASIRRSGRFLPQRPAELASLAGSQLDLIRLVLRSPGVSVAEAAKELRLAPNTVSTLVRQLTDERLLVRRVDPIDRRVARLELTPAMQQKVGAFRDRRVIMLVRAMGNLSASDQRRLAKSMAVLERVAELLDQEDHVDD
jgi:DNA-binding MarR family transcriptional regulator